MKPPISTPSESELDRRLRSAFAHSMRLRRNQRSLDLPRRTLPNIGSARAPVNFGDKAFAYRRNGRWRYRTPETIQQYGRRFLEAASDKELKLELAYRGYRVLGPPHECIDRPNLPCIACERDRCRFPD